jgi:dipeptidyl aminopeptidase/acylaminoacyl peptidase
MQILRNPLIVMFVGLFCVSTSVLGDQSKPVTSSALSSLTLEQIMANPDWMGNSPERQSWSIDGKAVYYQRKVDDHTHRELFKYSLETGKTSVNEKTESLMAASRNAVLNPSMTHGVFTFQSDLYIIELGTNRISALTADNKIETMVSFVDDNTISFRVGYQLFLYDLKARLAKQIAEFKTSVEPDKKSNKNYLEQSQPRLLEYIKQKQDEAEFQKQREKSNKLNTIKTWYLGKNRRIRTFRLSPDAKWLLLGTVKNGGRGQSDHMPEFVVETGYVNDRKVRPLVGTSEPTNESFYLFDLVKHKKHTLDLSKLPGINDDPLKSLRKKAAKKIGYKYKEEQGPRAVYAYNWLQNGGVAWTKDSRQAAFMLFSYDNKSRWIVSFDTDKKRLKTSHWLSDDAWVNDSAFNNFGWLADNETLYYLSEESGYSHFYIKTGKRRATQLTEGEFEVSNLTVSKGGDKVFYKANKKHPGVYEIYSLDMEKRTSSQLTDFNGMSDYVLSPDESKLVVSHSKLTKKPELYMLDVNQPTEKPIQLTDSMSPAFKAVPWQAPKIVEVPSSHVEKPIYSRLYEPASENVKSVKDNKRPAVLFVHGAGYLQNSHQGWSGYFREFMFHNYLTAKGYVVLDMDYRASKGYGRDWRTAIYRNMGTPELQDLKDGVNWLVENKNVDKNRVGVYGGSYGGFMTFMAMFKEPELFASGASLRPVTDWAHYNHGYTSNILNTPQVDPDAFERSSPIEFAEGLNKPLLICHGMVDDNVFFKDTVRLVQKLIELKKTKYFETAIYPVEPHGFVQPASWLDEYTRIEQLFERTLQ